VSLAWVGVCVCVCVCVCVYIHIYIYIYTNKINIYTQVYCFFNVYWGTILTIQINQFLKCTIQWQQYIHSVVYPSLLSSAKTFLLVQRKPCTTNCHSLFLLPWVSGEKFNFSLYGLIYLDSLHIYMWHFVSGSLTRHNLRFTHVIVCISIWLLFRAE
jgi:hypothetical protein